MDKKRKIVVINFSSHIYQHELLQFLHFDNSEISTKLFDFAFCNHPFKSFNFSEVFAIIVAYIFLTQIWSKLLNLHHCWQFSSFNISIEIKSTQMWSTSSWMKFRWLHLPYIDSNKDFCNLSDPHPLGIWGIKNKGVGGNYNMWGASTSTASNLMQIKLFMHL